MLRRRDRRRLSERPESATVSIWSRPRQPRVFSHYMALYAPVGAAFLVVYVCLGRILFLFLTASATVTPWGALRDTEMLARSTVDHRPGGETVLLEVGERDLRLLGRPLGELAPDASTGRTMAPDLYAKVVDALREVNDEMRAEAAELGRQWEGTGRIAIAPHAETPYAVLFDVVRAAGEAGFDEAVIAVVRSDRR